MHESNRQAPIYRGSGPNRYKPGSASETAGPDAFIRAAVRARTVAQLEDTARCAQRSGHWAQRDAAWCRALRSALLDNDQLALGLLLETFTGAELTSSAVGGAA